MGSTIILGIISIGILIFVHELGHFLSARAVGIKVEVFSIGWGKGIQLFKWKDTRIQLGWIPFGGYCKMAGDSAQDKLTGSKDEYYSSPPINRIIVALGGPLFNFFFAIILFSLIMAIGYQITTYPNKIILAKPKDINENTKLTPAQKAGLKNGDIIVAIDGRKITNWDDITESIVRNALKKIQITVLRNGKKLNLEVVPDIDKSTGRGIIGIYPWVDPIVGGVLANSDAKRLGIKPGDKIVSIDGIPIRNQLDFYNILSRKKGQSINLVIDRHGEKVRYNVLIGRNSSNTSLGIYFKQVKLHSPKYGLPKSIELGVQKSVEATRDTIRGMIFLFSGKIRAKTAIAGPAKIIYLSGVIAKEGIVYFFQVMSYISIAFFIMNLIPFPALDGSHIVIALYEAIRRKKPNLEVIQRIQAIGFTLLILLLLFVTFNDISSFIKR